MTRRSKHASAREGIHELIAELVRRNTQEALSCVVFFSWSTKWIHLTAARGEPPRTALIRPYNEFTVGYTTEPSRNDPALDKHVEVVRTADGRLYFRENRHLLTTSDFAAKLIRLVAGEV